MASSDVSPVTSFFSTANEGFSTTLGSTISAGATTVPLNSTSGLTNGTVFVGIIEPGQTAQQVFTGTVNTGSGSITNVVWTRGTNVGHTSGVTIVDYVTGTDHNMMTAGLLKAHGQDGLPKSGITYPASTFTTPTIADFTNANHTHASAGQGGQLGFGALLSTIFSGQVSSYTNSSGQGGTFYYINLGGIKLLWGSTNQIGGAYPQAWTLNLPAGFFTTIQEASGTATHLSVDVAQYVSITTTFPAVGSPTSIAGYLINNTGSGGAAGAITLFLIGT